MIRKFFSFFLFSIILLSWCGCAQDRISRTYPCRFVLYVQYHNPCKALTAVTTLGYPVKVSVYKNSNGSYRVAMTDQNGNTENQTITTQLETYAYSSGIYLGASNGIIICENSYDANPVAYDAQCPNCIDKYGSLGCPLSWSTKSMQVKCSKCNRVYDLNTGSILSGDNGDRLLEYGVTYDGNRLYVGN